MSGCVCTFVYMFTHICNRIFKLYGSLGFFLNFFYFCGQNALLEFKRVVKVKHQVVAGTAYYITLEATSGGQTKVYEAKVWEQPWMDFKQLVEFKLISDA